MDKHYLSYLFQPKSIVVFVGDADDPVRSSPFAKGLAEDLNAQKFKGSIQYFNIYAPDTLLELGKLKAELAIITLPHDGILTALDMAARIKCKAALVIGTGVSVGLAAEIHEVARRHGIHLLGPNSLGFQMPALQLNASVIGPMAVAGPLGLISQSGALTASILDWAKQNQVGFSNVVSLGPNSDVDIAQVLDYLQCTWLYECIAFCCESKACGDPKGGQKISR